jgi:mitochondrial fission protein ELM1
MTSCWIITETGLIGTENQSKGVAQALGLNPVVKRIQLRAPWRILTPYLGFEIAQSFMGDPLEAPWPDLVITSGRKSIAAARYIKRKNPKTVYVHLQDPRSHYQLFDLVAVPQHDPARGKNIFVTHAAPNLITSRLLENAKAQFSALIEESVAPKAPPQRVAVLIGGNSKAHKLTSARMISLCQDLKRLESEQNYKLMITVSRRTGAEQLEILKKALPHSLIWDGQGDNPYHAYLAYADYIMVTADSVSMIAEAATTGKPVYIIPLDGGSKRFNRFYDHLTRYGAIRPFEGRLDPFEYVPLDDAQAVAEKVQEILKIKA